MWRIRGALPDRPPGRHVRHRVHIHHPLHQDDRSTHYNQVRFLCYLRLFKVNIIFT